MKRWYELDGFATRAKDRYKLVRKVSTANHQNLSDHNAKVIVMSPEFLKAKKRNFFMKRNPNIDWEKMRDPETALKYQQETGRKLGNMTETEKNDWSKIEKEITETAMEVCGKRNKQLNPWISSHSSEHDELQKKLSFLLKE